MISDEAAEHYGSFIAENAHDLAEAQATYHFLDNYTKVVRSNLRSKIDGPQGQKDDYAQTHKEYKKHLEAVRIAEERWLELRFKTEAARDNIAIWQTQSANLRGLK